MRRYYVSRCRHLSQRLQAWYSTWHPALYSLRFSTLYRKHRHARCCKDLQLDNCVFSRFDAHQSVTNVQLTQREFALLQTLMENRSIVLSREKLLDMVWGYDYVGETNVVDVYIRYLRQKLDDAFHIKLIHTVRSVGYVIKGDGS